MRYGSLLRLIVAAVLVTQASCGQESTVPTATESLNLSIQTRNRNINESVPALNISGGSGTVVVQITRAAMCGTIVTAAVSRRSGELAVVSRISANPAAICPAIQRDVVIVYEGTIGALDASVYRVRVFEAIADGAPQLIGSGSVTVSRKAA